MESSIQNQPPVKRKRGRPPGTKNKPKAAGAPAEAKAAAKPVDIDLEVRSINAVVEKLDKAEGKVDQYYRTISQHVAAIKRARPDDWKEVVTPAVQNGRNGSGKKSPWRHGLGQKIKMSSASRLIQTTILTIK